MPHENIRISIGICTKDNHDLLLKCLQSISTVKGPEKIFEILIVDSSKDKEKVKNVISSTKLSGVVRIFQISELGISFARNVIFNKAVGDFLFFVDDDVTVSEKWLNSGITLFLSRKDCGVIGGKISPQNKIPKSFINTISKDVGYKKNFWPFTLFNLGNKTRELKRIVYYPMFANMAIRKNIYQNAQLDTRFANNTSFINKIYGGEDPDFIEQIKHQCSIYYCPQMEAFHFIKPYKFTRKYFMWRMWENGKETALFDFKYKFKKNEKRKPSKLYEKAVYIILHNKFTFSHLLSIISKLSYRLTYLKLEASTHFPF